MWILLFLGAVFVFGVVRTVLNAPAYLDPDEVTCKPPPER